MGSWEALSPFSAAEKREATLLEEHCVDFQNLDQEPESSVLSKCMWNAVQALPGYPVLGEDDCSFPLASLPQVRSARKSGTGGGSTPHGPAAPSGLGKPGIQKSHGQRKEPLGRKAKETLRLCCYSRWGQAALLTLLLYQGSRTSNSQFLKYGCGEDKYHVWAAQVGSALFHCQIAPGKTSLPRKSFLAFGATGFSSCCN